MALEEIRRVALAVQQESNVVVRGAVLFKDTLVEGISPILHLLANQASGVRTKAK